MRAIIAEVVDVKPLRTSQVTKITLEIPIEHFKRAAVWFGVNVLVVESPGSLANHPFGVFDDVSTD